MVLTATADEAVYDEIVALLLDINGTGIYQCNVGGQVYRDHVEGRGNNGGLPFIEVLPGPAGDQPGTLHTDGREDRTMDILLVTQALGEDKATQLRALKEDIRQALYSDYNLNGTCEEIRMQGSPPLPFGSEKQAKGWRQTIKVTVTYETPAVTP